MEDQQKQERGSRAVISAKYLPLLGAFRAGHDDVRYYLHGISIEPHEEQGAYIVATDGHRMVVVHDEEAQVFAPMLLNPEPLIIRESKRALLADFEGDKCELQDENEAFLLSARAPSIDGNFPDWRTLIPADNFECFPGSLDPELLAAIRKAPFGDKSQAAMFYVRTDKPTVIRFPSLPEIFVLVMPMSVPAMTLKPEWIKKRKKTKAPAQNELSLAGANTETTEQEAA